MEATAWSYVRNYDDDDNDNDDDGDHNSFSPSSTFVTMPFQPTLQSKDKPKPTHLKMNSIKYRTI